MSIPKGKKRGRKPKGTIMNYQNIINEMKKNSEEEPIIGHIPLLSDSEKVINGGFK